MDRGDLPDNGEALFQASRIAAGRGDLHRAVAQIEQAITIDATDPRFHRLAAALYHRLSRSEDRLAALQRAAALAPDELLSWHDLELAYSDLGDFNGLRDAADQAVEARPDNAAAHSVLASVLLREGAFAEGWRAYEWRLKLPGAAGGLPPDDWRRWDGSPMPDQRLLVFCDQGRGDIIQFARYIPWAAERCPDLAVCCPMEMWPILRQFPCIRVLVEHWHQAGPCAAFIPIGSLPMVAGTRVETIPCPVPYLRADPFHARSWQAQLDRLLPRRYRRVGLVWAGNPAHQHDRSRSIELGRLRPLADIRGVAFVAMQLGAAQAQAGQFFGRAPIVNIAPDIKGFRDTMAILETLDLLISVDTGIVHLAGAMGRPAWVLLPWLSDWRWLTNRETSPWYPTMRLFRQSAPGRWDPVIDQVARALACEAA
jgi:tetratricopeptide (TPR) repeat protein